MQKMNKPCIYCVDVRAVDYANTIEERNSLGGAMSALRNMLTLRVEKSGSGTTFQRDESADYTLSRYKDFIKEISANPHFRVNVRAYANDAVYAGMLLDTAVSNALEEGAHRLFVIGFAETATGIAAGVCHYLDNVVYYQNTTREQADNEEYLYFTESHSHATDQMLRTNQH